MSLNWKLPWWGHHPYNLMFFLVGSVLLHGVVFLGLETYSRWSPNRTQASSNSTIPVEYIDVPAQVAIVPPPAAERRALTNTVAGGAARPKLPSAAGAGGATPIPSSQSTAQSSSSSAQPSQPAQQPQSSPLVDLQTSATGNLNLPPSPIPKASLSQRQQASPTRTVPSVQKNRGGPALKPRPAKQPNANRPVPNQKSPSVDARQDTLLGGYLNMLRREVDQQWLAKEPDATYRVMVAFSVSREGEVTALRILRSSGSSLRDQAALKAVQQAAPFAPLPARYRPSRVDVEFGFNNKVNRKPQPKK